MSGAKTFEIRKNDRDYEVGDSIVFNVVADDCHSFEEAVRHPLNGATAEIVDNSRYDPGTYFVGCLYCGARSDYEHGEENAAELWNGRVEPNGD